MKIPFICVALTAMALSACTPVAPQATSTLGSSPVIDGGGFSTGGGLSVAAEIQQINGMTALCGAWSESRRQSALSRGRANGVMGTGSAYLNGQVIHRGLLFMRKLDADQDYAGQPANCVITERPWSAGSESLQPVIRIPRQVVHRELDDMGGVVIEVLFRQTGPVR